MSSVSERTSQCCTSWDVAHTGAAQRLRSSMLATMERLPWPASPSASPLAPTWTLFSGAAWTCCPLTYQTEVTCLPAGQFTCARVHQGSTIPGRFTAVWGPKLTPYTKASHSSIRRHNEWSEAEHLEALMVLQLLCRPEPAVAPSEAL